MKKVLVFLICLFVGNAWASSKPINGITWTYTVVNGGVCIGTGNYNTAVPTSTQGDIEIPSVVDGYAVTSIGDDAFYSCSELTSVTMPTSVMSIGEAAFCRCGGLMSVTIPEGVTSIKDYTFQECGSLTSMTIPSSVMSIGCMAFCECRSLTSITIPSGVTSIGEGAFVSCSGLKSFFVDSNNPSYSSRNGLLCSKDGTILIAGLNHDVMIPAGVVSVGDGAFRYYRGLTSVTIPNGVTSIGERAFHDCRGLMSATIPLSVTSIGEGAFYLCSGLTSLTIPSKVMSMGRSAFSDCSGLTSVVISEGVPSISEYAFYDCSGLTSVTIPSSVTNIGDYAFVGCSGLVTIHVDKGDAERVRGLLASSGLNVEGLTFVSGPHTEQVDRTNWTYIIRNGKAELIAGSSAIGAITIPSVLGGCSVAGIGDCAFGGCCGLTSVTIPSSVTYIANTAFSDCEGLISFFVDADNPSYSSRNGLLCSKNGTVLFAGVNGNVTIPEGLTDIGDCAFSGYGGLTSVSIPSTVTNVASTAFAGCANVKSVAFDTWPGMSCPIDFEMSGWADVGNGVYQTERQSQYSQTLVLKAEVEGPKNTVFRWRATYSGNYLRYYIDGVQQSYLRYDSEEWQEVQVNVPAGRHEIKWEYYNSSKTGDYYGWVDLSGWKYIPAEMSRLFPDSYASIQEVAIGNDVTRISKDAFLGCESLERVDVESFDVWHGIEFANATANPLSAGARLYVGGEELRELVLPDGIMEIGEYEFQGGSFTSVTIPNSVTNIAPTAFSGCFNIASVEFGAWPEMLHMCKPEMSGWSAVGDNVYQTERQSKYDQTLVLKAEVEGPKKTSFRWKATYSGNYLRYYIDGVQQSYLGYAYEDWQEVQVNVPAGRHEIKWEYSTSYSYGDYYGWVDLSGWSYYAPAEVPRLFPHSYANIQQVSIRNGVKKIGADAFLGCENLKRVDAESLDGWLGIEFANDAANPLNCGADLYVNGVKQVYTISFDTACELEAPSALACRPGLACGELPRLAREGWMFLGWFTAATGGEQVTSETKADANRMLYAHWLGVSDVEVFSGWPWQEVVIGYTIAGETDEPLSLKMTATDNATGKTYACKTLEGVDFAPGRHVIKWNATADGVKFKSDDVVFTVRIVPQLPLYCVIDLSDGSLATGYPVTGLNAVPREGWTDEYKMTKLVLRRIDAGTFKMQNQYDVTLSRPFYMGVFEVTQKQYELVTGGNPSSYKGEMRPVEYVSYNMIRGSSEGAKWPEANSVDATSFLGKLRARTNLDFDLPTEAQWEYACRAGTTSAFNNGGSSENDLKQVGRYYNNRSDGKGGRTDAHTVVGSYQPNAWGLYDMHGNVWEWCLDWHEYGSVGAITDPKGVDWGSNRERRGGSWYSSLYSCTSSYRSGYYPSSSDYDGGFRLAWPLQDGDSTGDAEVSEASSASVPVDTTFVEGTNVEAVLSVAYGSVTASGCRITANGAEIANSTASGVKEWSPSAWGEYRMTYVGGVTMESTVVMEAEKVRDPVIAPPDGTIFETSCCTVSVSCATAGATIYFTKNGTTPRAKPAFLYTGPFEITDTATIVALAVKDGQQSEYVEATITRASSGPLTLASALGEPKLCDIATGGNGEWVPVEDDEGKERKTSALSGVLEEDDEGTTQMSWLEAKVYGKGTLTFWWRTSCEADPRGVYTCDYAEFKADGIVVAHLDGITDGWVPVTATFDTVGEHVLRWSYNADGWLAMEGEYEDCAWVNGVVWTPSAAPVVGPTIEGDEGATVTGDAEAGFVVKPSEGNTAVEVTIPQGVDAAKVTVVVSPKVASVKPNGVKVKVVVGEDDITNYLVIPESEGVMNIAAATVREEIVKETLDPSKDAVIELNAANPRLTTAQTRKGLTYTLYEGRAVESLSKGDSKLGDGDPWTPTIKVLGGNTAFYSIGVTK